MKKVKEFLNIIIIIVVPIVLILLFKVCDRYFEKAMEETESDYVFFLAVRSVVSILFFIAYGGLAFYIGSLHCKTIYLIPLLAASVYLVIIVIGFFVWPLVWRNIQGVGSVVILATVYLCKLLVSLKKIKRTKSPLEEKE